MLTRLLIPASFLVLAVLMVGGHPRAAGDPIVSMDTDTSGNSATTVGTVEPCRSVGVNAPAFSADVVVQGVLSLSGFEADVLYDPSLLTVTGSLSTFMLGGGTVLDFSDAVPDADGRYHIVIATTANAAGSGVIIRLTLRPNVGASGVSPLDLTQVKMKDFNNATIPPLDGLGFYAGPVNDGSVAIGVPCGWTPTPTPPAPTPTPTPAPDADGDGVADAADNCPSWPNPAQSLPPWPVPAGDPDCDGFATPSEDFMTTVATVQCAATPTANDEALPDDWAVDNNDDMKSALVDILAYIPIFNSTPPGPPYNARFDINTDRAINLADILAFIAFFNKSCSR